jgi:deoxyribodipyrimidine photo-lyase
LAEAGFAFKVLKGTPVDAFQELSNKYNIRGVYAGIDYEPYSTIRDRKVEDYLRNEGSLFIRVEDRIILSPSELVKSDGTPYTVFTPFKKRWMEVIKNKGLKEYPSEKMLGRLFKQDEPWTEIQRIDGFQRQPCKFPSSEINYLKLKSYDSARDFPFLDGTSHLGIHLSFGTISIRKLYEKISKISSVFINELIWREFYQMILYFHPRVVNRCFKPAYENIKWLNREDDLQAWVSGTTGYPLVDAGMRELHETGFMHNRVRMVTASFLTKHLLVDWRFGEAVFSRYLLDYEMASNNGGWQWAAGTGSDSAPYFRVFNPVLQARKYDPEERYIRLWLPEYHQGGDYIKPIIDHVFARNRAIQTYRVALSKPRID